MSLRQLEAEILCELRIIEDDPKIRQKDIMEWSTGALVSQEGETHVLLPNSGIQVCYRKRL